MSGYVPVQVGDTVRLRKAHPCGGRDWQVVRIGADIGLVCSICSRKILLTREEFERRCTERFPASESAESADITTPTEIV